MHIELYTAFILLIFTFFLWLFHELHVEKNKSTNKDSLSKKLKINNFFLTAGTGLSIMLLFSLLFYNLFVSPLFFYPYAWVSIFGSLLALLGIVIRWQAIRTLKEYFDANIQIKQDQELIQHGLFRTIRHPSYTGSLLAFLGFGIASLNLITAVVLPSFLLLVYIQRIRLEEEVLLKGFGQKYVIYQKDTGALFPKITSVKERQML